MKNADETIQNNEAKTITSQTETLAAKATADSVGETQSKSTPSTENGKERKDSNNVDLVRLFLFYFEHLRLTKRCIFRPS